ncbi:MAG: hypothetical protein R3F43_29795 [bacterium]
MPGTYGPTIARWHMLAWSVALVPVSLALAWLGVAGWIYLSLAALLGLGLVGMAVRGLRTEKPVAWARSYFLYTLAYLTLLFAALLVDAGPIHG